MHHATRSAAPQIPKDVAERIGEGQRVVTQLMSDRAQRAALPEGVPRT